jgi:hypothetical protein
MPLPGSATLRTSFSALTLAIACSFALDVPRTLRAQEDAISPPVPLQWPEREANPAANGELSITILRQLVESGANAALCKMLMRRAGDTIPPGFQWNACPPNYKAMIAAGEGDVYWVSGARPTSCGTSCVRTPFITVSTARDRPNTVHAMLHGHLDFGIRLPVTSDRSVRYGYEALFRCVIPPGQRVGKFEVRVVFDRPVVSEPGLVESIQDALTLHRLTDWLDAFIRGGVSTPPTATSQGADCTSIGVDAATPSSADRILFNIPTARESVVPHAPTPVTGDSAVVRFISITRKPPLFGYSPAQEPGSFMVYLNGIPVAFPTRPELVLPVGGTATINLCRTINLGRADRLQLIFANSDGGATWSEFTRAGRFGARVPHRMTTGRTVAVRGLPGLPTPPVGPLSGRPRTTRPHSIVVREFELLYTIDYFHRADEVEPPRDTGPGARPAHAEVMIFDRPLRDPGGGDPTPPCRQL